MNNHHAYFGCTSFVMKFWNMPKIPRDVSGKELVQCLGKLKYRVVRQTGSHIRLECTGETETHRLTIPDHNFLKIGTLNGILSDVAEFHCVGKSVIMETLFED